MCRILFLQKGWFLDAKKFSPTGANDQGGAAIKNGGMLRRHGFYISLWGGGLPEAWGWAEVQLGQQRLGNDGCVAAKALSGRVFASVMPKKRRAGRWPCASSICTGIPGTEKRRPSRARVIFFWIWIPWTERKWRLRPAEYPDRSACSSCPARQSPTGRQTCVQAGKEERAETDP